MIYYTQLIYIKRGCEAAFHAFEDHVLPLIENYNGKLLYRIRPQENAFIAHNGELPYEIHLVSFSGRSEFEQYAKDPRRLEALELKSQSVEKIILIEGHKL